MRGSPGTRRDKLTVRLRSRRPDRASATTAEDADHDGDHEGHRDGDRRPHVHRVGGVGAGERAVETGEDEHGVAREVDRPPRRAGQAFHRQRCRLHRDQAPQGEHSEGHLPRLPAARERDENVGETEVDEVVGDEGADVDRDEPDGEPGQPAVQIEQPGRAAVLREQARGEHDAPHDRRRQEQPRRDAGTTSDVPPHLRVHEPTFCSTGTAPMARRSIVAVVSPADVVATPLTPWASRYSTAPSEPHSSAAVA